MASNGAPSAVTRRWAALCLAVMVGGLAPLEAQRFYRDDPVWIDTAMVDTPEPPAEVELSDLYDRFGHIFGSPGSPEWGEASNVNTLDEVPDSAWFTNRIGRAPMSLEALVRGPDTIGGPDMSGPWVVFRSKTQGLTPGYEVRDAEGNRWVIKLDPVDLPELASGAEVIATKLFYALGYHTPQNFIVRVHPDRFEIEEGTTLEDDLGNEVALTPGRFLRTLRRVPRLPDGRIRVTASRYIEGLPIGPFRYYGTRSDDPNDVVPHENRRELRGLRVFAAWLNHDDTRAHNTLDAWVEVEGLRFVRHHLLDFGSTLGSGSVEAQLPHLGYHYWLDMALVKRNIATFGLVSPYYRSVEFPSYPSIGRYEAEYYRPHEWRNDYPNPAFVRMTARDAFWAAKIMARLTPDQIRAIVATGEYTDPDAAEYLVETIVARQQKTARYYINLMNPLDEFAVDATELSFANLAERYGFAATGATYEVTWSTFDNGSGETRPLVPAARYETPRVPLPAGADPAAAAFLLAEIYSLHDAHPDWNARIGVFLRPTGAGWEVVGLERESPPLAPM